MMQVALSMAGLGFTAIVALVGSWPWCIARAFLVSIVVSRAMTAITRRSPRVAGLAASAVGLIAVSVGSAIVVPEARVSGWTLRAAGGALAAGGGATLLLVGAGVLLRSLRGWKRGAVVPIGLLLTYVIGQPLVIATVATNVPRAHLGLATPADVGLVASEVRFTTSDRVSLAGWFVPSRNGAAVVVVPGASSTRTAVLDQAAVLARHGYGVLLYDPRGMGRSAGRAMNRGWYGTPDVQAAVTYLTRQPSVQDDRIGVLGESMGGEEAIGASATDPRIRAVVAEGATNRVAADNGWLDDEYGVRGRFQQVVDELTELVTDQLTAASPPIALRAAVVRSSPRPVLLVAAGRVREEIAADRWIAAASPSNVRVWVVPAVGHTGGLRTQPVEWERRVVTFLGRALSGR